MNTFLFLNSNQQIPDSHKTAEMMASVNFSVGDYIIAVDGGYKIISQLNHEPSLIIGDFDSLSRTGKLLTEIHPGAEVISFPKMKDKSDFELAIEYIPDATEEVIVFGITGGRFDHSFANIMAAATIRKPALLLPYIFDEFSLDEQMFLIQENTQLIVFAEKLTISLFSLSEKGAVITTENYAYELDNATLPPFSSRGLSNIANDSESVVTCHQGKVLMIVNGYCRYEFQTMSENNFSNN